MKNRIKKRCLYARYTVEYQQILHKNQRLCQHFDPLQLGNEIWGNVVPVGREFGAKKTVEDHRD